MIEIGECKDQKGRGFKEPTSEGTGYMLTKHHHQKCDKEYTINKVPQLMMLKMLLTQRIYIQMCSTE